MNAALSALALLAPIMCLDNMYKPNDPVLPPANFYKPSVLSIENNSPSLSYGDNLPLVAKISPQNPTAFGEGSFYKLLYPSMTRITSYFNDHSTGFSNWYQSPNLIMSKGTRDEIVSDLYKAQPKDDRELKEFWGSIMGELLIRDLPELKSMLGALKEAQNEEKKKISAYEFKEINDRKTDEEDNFFGTGWFILDSLSLGVSNRNAEIYTDVIGSFLDAAVAFKSLEHNFSTVTGSSRSTSTLGSNRV